MTTFDSAILKLLERIAVALEKQAELMLKEMDRG